MNKIYIGLCFVIIFFGILFYVKPNSKESTKEEPSFIESSTFSGGKKGYVYKMDSQDSDII